MVIASQAHSELECLHAGILLQRNEFRFEFSLEMKKITPAIGCSNRYCQYSVSFLL
jgi:hypothetical protein